MKFRTDFVTNSSSSGFVAIKIAARNDSIEIGKEYDAGYGGWIWGGSTAKIVPTLNSVTDGQDLCDALNVIVKNFEYFGLKNSDILSFAEQIKSRNDLLKISLAENTYFEDGGTYRFLLEYDFQKKRIIDWVDEEKEYEGD